MDLEVIYSASMERDYIRSQQRTPDPLPSLKFTRETVADTRNAIAMFLQRFPQAWTVSELSRLLRRDEFKVYHALKFWQRHGRVTREHLGRGFRGKPQRYRWIKQVASVG